MAEVSVVMAREPRPADEAVAMLFLAGPTRAVTTPEPAPDEFDDAATDAGWASTLADIAKYDPYLAWVLADLTATVPLEDVGFEEWVRVLTIRLRHRDSGIDNS